MVGVITAVLAGSIAAPVAIVASDRSPAAALSALMRHQRHAQQRAATALLTADGNEDAAASTDRIRPP
jgi:hypothetical protein